MEQVNFRYITPEVAKKILENNVGNRTLKPQVIKRYAEDMRGGRWDEGNCQPIVIDENNVLKDGQHRLNAVIKSGVTIRFLVVTQVNEKTHIFDRGALRDTKDVAEMAGCKGVTKEIVTTTKTYFLKLSYCIPSFSKIRNYTDGIVIDYIMENIELLDKAVRISRKGHSSGNGKIIGNRSPFFVVIFMALKCGYSENMLFRYMEIINTGFFDGSDIEGTAIVMRNQFINEGDNGAAYNGYEGRKKLMELIETNLYEFLNHKPRKRIYRNNSITTRLSEQSYAIDKELFDVLLRY